MHFVRYASKSRNAPSNAFRTCIFNGRPPSDKSNLKYTDKAVATPENAKQVQSGSDPDRTQVASLYRDA